MKPTFEEVLRSWRSYYDYVPVNSKERKDAFILLIHDLKQYGYDQKDLNNERKQKIIRLSVNPDRNRKKLKTWITMAVRDLESAILTYYSSIVIEHDPSNVELTTLLAEIENKG